MLPLLLMLVTDPLAAPAPAAAPDPFARLRVVTVPPEPRCAEPGFVMIGRSSGQADRLQTDLTYRRDGEVRRYLLLDRWERGCPAPISFALPGQPDGFIRELGRSAPVSPAPAPVQPPRSSE